jgi:hypothetical protein
VASPSWTRRIVETIALAPLYSLVPDSASEQDGEPGARGRGGRRAMASGQASGRPFLALVAAASGAKIEREKSAQVCE